MVKFPRFLSVYVPRCGISLYEAIERITALPAKRLGLSQKGTLQKGADADVVIFDPDRLHDRATFDEPTLPPEGISYVLIGGRIAVKDGIIENGRLGRTLRRK